MLDLAMSHAKRSRCPTLEGTEPSQMTPQSLISPTVLHILHMLRRTPMSRESWRPDIGLELLQTIQATGIWPNRSRMQQLQLLQFMPNLVTGTGEAHTTAVLASSQAPGYFSMLLSDCTTGRWAQCIAKAALSGEIFYLYRT